MLQYAGAGPGAQRRLCAAILPALVSLPASHAVAQDPAANDPDRGLPQSFLAEVAAAHSGRSLRLSDGRAVILPHILPPGADRFQPRDDRPFERRATRALADLVLGRTVRIDLALPPRDRYGRLRATVTLPDGGDLAERMAALGQVRVMPEPGADPARIARLLAAEETARTTGTGFWSGLFRIRHAEPYGGDMDRFRIVEGTVLRVSRIGRRRHLEFGADWRSDFTVGVPNSARRAFTDAGRDPETLAGRTVRARGWVRDWNGPFMEIDDPAMLELLD